MIKRRNGITVKLTYAQSATLNRIPRWDILKQLYNGDVVVAPQVDKDRLTWIVVDAKGKISGFDYYLSI